MGMAMLAGAILIVPSMAKADGPKDRDARKPRITANNGNRNFGGRNTGRNDNGRFDRDNNRDRKFDNDHKFGRGNGWFGNGGGKFGHGAKTGFVSVNTIRPAIVNRHVERDWIAPVYQTRERKIWVEPVYDLREKCVTSRDRFGRVTSRIITERVLVREGYFRFVEETVLVTPGHYVDHVCGVSCDRHIGVAAPGFGISFRW
jgi:hypothetical protein